MDKSDLVKAALDAGASYPEAYAYVLTIFAVAGPGFMLDNEDQMKSAWLQVLC